MRKTILLLFLASAAMPAFAKPSDDDRESRRESAREARSERAESNENRASRPSRADRGESSRGSTQGVGRTQRDSGPSADGPSAPRQVSRRQDGGSSGPSDSSAPTVSERSASESVRFSRENRAGDTVRNWRGRDRERTDSPAAVEERNLRRNLPAAERDGDPVEWRSLRRSPVAGSGDGSGESIERRNLRVVRDDRREGPLVRDVPTTGGITERRLGRIGGVRPTRGVQPPAPDTARLAEANPTRRWDGNWRHHRRYDWRDWRRRHRSRFHLGFYFDPFGWNYFRYGIGWRLWPSYYGSRYWLRDPWYYRLPPAYGPYRWVRYHNDALLVNIYTGNVIDVVYNFFW